MDIVRWVLWCIVLWFALSFSYGCRRVIEQGKDFHRITAVQAFLWCIIAIVFLFSDVEKLHILWLIPLVFFGTGIVVQIPVIGQLLSLMSGVFMTVILFGYAIRIEWSPMGYLVKRDFDKEALMRKKWKL